MGVGAGLYLCDVVVKSSRSLFHLLMSFLLKACIDNDHTSCLHTGWAS